MVVERDVADGAGLEYDFVAAMITLGVGSRLHAVGLTAAVSSALADAGISCNVVAGHFHDHLFVPVERAEEALELLDQIWPRPGGLGRSRRPALRWAGQWDKRKERINGVRQAWFDRSRGSRLCLGCMSFGDPHGAGTRGAWVRRAARPIIRQALEAGINFFDTANVYSDGSSEEIVGAALADFAQREEVVLATKVHGRMRPGPNGAGLSRKAIMAEIDNSLRRLRHRLRRPLPDPPLRPHHPGRRDGGGP